MTPAGAAVAERAGGRSGVPRWLRPAVITAGVLVLAPVGFTENTYIQTVLILTLLLVVSSSGWNIISGFAGYVSLGQGAFIGVGAYTVGILSRHTDVSPFVLAPLGGVAAAALAAVLGLVAMRARGHAFVVSAVLIGIAGGIDGYFLTFIDPRGMFDILISVQIVLAALLGGRGTIWGPVLGAFLLQPLSEVVNNYFGTRLGIRLLVFGSNC